MKKIKLNVLGRNKTADLQPWLDYFEMLQTYEQKGFLEVAPDKHEAYITRAALYTLADAIHKTADSNILAAITDTCVLTSSVFDTARRIRTYAAWCSQQGEGYLSWHFALHVVGEDASHDLITTLLLTRRRRWWCPWRKTEYVEIITY